MNRVGVPSTWPEAGPLSTSWRIRSATDAGPVPVEHRHVEAELGGAPEQIAVSSAFRRWNSNSRMSQNRLCSAPPQLRQRQWRRRRAGGCWSTEMSERVVRRAVSASLSAVRGEYRSADRRDSVADQECDQAGDRLRRDRVRHRLVRERDPVCGGVEQLGRDRVHLQSRATAKAGPEPAHSRLSVADRVCGAPVARITVIR